VAECGDELEVRHCHLIGFENFEVFGRFEWYGDAVIADPVEAEDLFSSVLAALVEVEETEGIFSYSEGMCVMFPGVKCRDGDILKLCDAELAYADVFSDFEILGDAVAGDRIAESVIVATWGGLGGSLGDAGFSQICNVA
jgi:hypothetical protein